MPKDLFAKTQINFSPVFYFWELLKHRPLGLFVYLNYINLEFYFMLPYVVYKKPWTRKVTECFVYLYLQKQPPEEFCLKPATLLKKRPWHRCFCEFLFSVNFTKFLRAPFLQNTFGRLFLYLPKKKIIYPGRSVISYVLWM